VGGVAGRGVGGRRRDRLVDGLGIVQALQRVGVFGEAGDAVEGRAAAQRDHRVVVLDLGSFGQFDDAGRRVEVDHLAPDERRIPAGDGADGDRHVVGDRRVPDDAVDLVEDEVVVLPGHPRQLGVRKLALQALDRRCTGVASSEHDDPLAHTLRWGDAGFMGFGTAGGLRFIDPPCMPRV
jgi:hypothetical protein